MRIEIVLAFLLLETAAYAAAVQHQFEGSCDVCHQKVPQQPGDDPALTKDVNGACLSCHQVPAVGHPVDVKAEQAQIPAGFPLQSLRVHCATCHQPCDGADANNPYMLRGELRQEAFCSNCHAVSALPDKKKHYGISGIAHPRSTEPLPGDTGITDDITDICLSCHLGGGAGPPANVLIGETALPGHSHRVGQDYEQRAGQNRELTNYEAVAEVVVLREGKVGCLSCHNIYSQHPPLLTMSNSGSGLCLTCHNK